jgi:hypothetical protein
MIEGSSEIVRGVLQKSANLTISIRDSGRLTRIKDLVLLGLFIQDDKDQMTLINTNYISA